MEGSEWSETELTMANADTKPAAAGRGSTVQWIEASLMDDIPAALPAISRAELSKFIIEGGGTVRRQKV